MFIFGDFSMEDNIYNLEYVKGLFNRMSSSYERVNYITSFGFSIRWRKQFLQTLTQTSNKVENYRLAYRHGRNMDRNKKQIPQFQPDGS